MKSQHNHHTAFGAWVMYIPSKVFLRIQTAWIVCLILSGCAAKPDIAMHVDFSSTQGLQQTCAQFKDIEAAQLRSDVAKVAYVVCDAVALTQDTGKWWRGNASNLTVNSVRAQLVIALERITKGRQLLETVRAEKLPLTLAPGNWILDLDGDGEIGVFERYFFWVPRLDSAVAIGGLEPTQTAEHYQRHFTSPVVQVDQADVRWAIAYCYFAEAIIHLALSYDIAYDLQTRGNLKLLLADGERVRKTVYPRLLAGIRYSKATREALLKETDDHLEWIPNPKQKNTSFPLRMDEQTFITWGKLLEHTDELLAGRTLLGGVVPTENRFVRELTFGICNKNEGLNLKDLLDRPIKDPTSNREWKSRCQHVDEQMRLSAVGNLLAEIFARNAKASPDQQYGEWVIARYFYWVN